MCDGLSAAMVGVFQSTYVTGVSFKEFTLFRDKVLYPRELSIDNTPLEMEASCGSG